MAGRLDSVLWPESDGQGRAAGLAPRLALLVVTVVFAGFAVNAFQYVYADDPSPTHWVPAAASLALMMVLQLGFFSRPGADVSGPRGYAALLTQGLLTFVPMAFYHEAWTGMPGFLAGDALLVLRPAAAGWAAFAGIAAVAGFIQYNLTGTGLEVGYIANLTMTFGLVVYGLSRLRLLVRELEDARSELAGLAVARERLRFARDLHDLLGFSLSAVTLKTELTHRLVPAQPDRAKQELDEILGISRQALSDVRAVASSYRELSLDDELASARSVLTAAEVAVEVRATPGDLAPRVRTVLATVLREGVTNLLRHSKAENCAITVSRTGSDVSIEIVNDGVRADVESHGPGNGLGNLTQRVKALGGSLTAQVDDDTYRLFATIPLSGTESTDPDVKRVVRGPEMAPRLGFVIAAAVFTGYAVSSIILVFARHLPLTAQVVGISCVVASWALMLGFFSRPSAAVRSRLGYTLLGAQAVITYLPVLLFENPFLGMTGFLAGASLLVLPPRLGIPVFLAVMLTGSAAHWAFSGNTINIVYGSLVTINQGLVAFGLSRLRSMVQKLHDARSELAHAAVTRERLRFARDLHDLLGYSLSAITLKSELTTRLVARDPERAQQELSGILDISRQALADVRAVASSYREMSLDEETVSARALLAAANINVTLRLDPCELPQDVRTTLATVLREGVTNLLRHSKASNCEITLSRQEDRLTMAIVNDGVLPGVSRNGGGSGIHNLTARVSDVGGRLEAHTIDDTYRLQATIPLA
ncbi:two-component sensor histidine kinase [Lentzea sp. NBRC 105346]|uniref:sensor histidine kinase n=1 Tax=Lentzea sp. NBRC 105346 TaxID=3032205 RepID=UPI0024A1AA84|nr:histidine kinase [Lentzea sp. NBRC 105346]GLZ36163.1 two-component sensor histidine kinase [Lentzea sp. NBRC 105346]